MWFAFRNTEAIRLFSFGEGSVNSYACLAMLENVAFLQREILAAEKDPPQDSVTFSGKFYQQVDGWVGFRLLVVSQQD
jgi:hypothetical protein